MSKAAWARYGMNKARGMAQKQARFDAGEAEGREAALAAEAGADREVLRQAATGAAWREAEAATDAARGEAERLAATEGMTELKAKIAEFKEKGINTDELERVLAECEAEMGEAERLAALVEPQPPRRALPWLALACGLLCVLAAWLAVSAAVEALAVLGGVVLLLVAFHGFRQPVRLPPVLREQRAAIEEGERAGILDNFMTLGAKVAIENPHRVLAVVAVITLITGYAAMGISTEFNFNDLPPA